MATVIRSPQLNKKPRKLHGSETAVAPARQEPAEIREPREQYAAPQIQPLETTQVAAAPQTVPAEPVVTLEEFTELQHGLERAESRADVAERELAAIQSDLESLHAQAREAGFASGSEQANKELDAEYRQRLQAVDRILESLSSQLEGLVAQAEDSIVETVYAAVAKIIGDQLVHPDSISAVVRHVATQLVRPEKFTVRLAPADYELIASDRERLFEGVAETSPVRILPDPRIELGGCILESAAGSLDARLEVQLQRLKDVLLDSRARRQSELQSKK